ncbi:L-serine ammonia-lyase, iron-sulfur-dependent subunit beta [Ammoniphilus sp. YIM 78166]|uniref:L-serine ammonia-lyase, iron-sulfur-dependent subunit beta n=1 Tax=Ammoniphilus sp. YIM 78166 TaxID=1644106 RepID=UPI00106F991C|nr:L-serine ammonia-lyase, iron-sulfur-dependent subunit beta [Ammoniphilus sp. YIM 78166]
MLYNSCFDIIGPIMVGPSSSHTAGVVSIGKFVYDFLEGSPDQVTIVFYDSFAETHKGHGTDKAIIGGLIGMDTDDVRIRDAVEMAEEQGIEIRYVLENQCPYYDHPNTVLIQTKKNGETETIGGVSLGGGISKIFHINGFSVDIPLNAAYDLDQLKEYKRNLIYS